MRIIYLHGFASGPSSSKAQFFRAKFAEHGIAIEIPQLDQGHFEALTITGQLSVIDRTVGGDDAILMGSSLGGYLAALYAARHSNIQRLILLAPAFQFPAAGMHVIRRSNWTNGSHADPGRCSTMPTDASWI